MGNYYLMHKNIKCGNIAIDDISGAITAYKDFSTGASPYMGTADLNKMKKWWEMRTVPATRNMMQEILKRNECFSPEAYLTKNLGLSMTDAYWICPFGMDLKYEDVKFLNFKEFNEGKIPYHNASSYNPDYDLNSSLGGQMEKYWDLNAVPPTLIKESSKYYGLQSMNEVVATYIHDALQAGIPYVRYSAIKTDDITILSKCDAFTSDTVEFISAYEILESHKGANDKALYDQYIEACVKYGIGEDVIQRFMDYQTVTDFIISNTDEHLQNFGVLRDADTLKLIGPAPIFDSGNSMFYNETRSTPFSRVELLQRNITSFYKTEDKMLSKVKDRNIVKTELLPSSAEIRDIYMSVGIPERKVDFICKNYETKIEMTKDFQKGMSISLYHEKKKEKMLAKQEKSTAPAQKFIMVCGLPGSGKTEKAKALLNGLKFRGASQIEAKEIYPLPDILKHCRDALNKQAIMDGIKTNPDFKGCATIISANGIRDELKQVNVSCDNDLVFTIVEARIAAALKNQVSVVYEATNLNTSDRKRFIALADQIGVSQKELYVKETTPEAVAPYVTIPTDKLERMYELLYNNPPTSEEGWTKIYSEPSEVIGLCETDPEVLHEDELEAAISETEETEW